MTSEKREKIGRGKSKEVKIKYKLAEIIIAIDLFIDKK
jgi:hypothetical protein